MLPIIETIPAFNDNYIWLFYPPDKKQGWVVDPGDAKPVLKKLEALGLELEGILVTHQHPDHIGGIPELLEAYPSATVIGPGDISLVARAVSEGDQVQAADVSFTVIEVPGHTLNHLAFYAGKTTRPILFCGDTLFAGGCGRLFEGTPEQMHNSLSRLSRLPDETLVYCAHEYTLANLSFASAVEPDKKALLDRIAHDRETRARQLPTVPSTIGLEKKTNPFLRASEASVVQNIALKTKEPLDTEVAVFAATRKWKDNF